MQETLIKILVTDKENDNGVGRNVSGLARASAALSLCLCSALTGSGEWAGVSVTKAPEPGRSSHLLFDLVIF